MRHVNAVWDRVRAHAGQEFRTATGLTFTYEVLGSYLRVSRTTRNLSRQNFARAIERMPAPGPGRLQDLQGPSYTWAILMDPRIREGDW